MATSPEVLASLNDDLALEHSAVVRYVIHGVQLRGVVSQPGPPDVPADRGQLVGSASEAHEAARAAGQHEYHRYRLGQSELP